MLMVLGKKNSSYSSRCWTLVFTHTVSANGTTLPGGLLGATEPHFVVDIIVTRGIVFGMKKQNSLISCPKSPPSTYYYYHHHEGICYPINTRGGKEIESLYNHLLDSLIPVALGFIGN